MSTDKRFLVIVHGRNHLVTLEHKPALCGFVTHRVVTAPDEVEAKAKAIEAVRAHGKVAQKEENNATVAPGLTATRVYELGPDSRATDAGFLFYEEGDTEGEQEAVSISLKAAMKQVGM
jgi:hypothetical protein